MILLIGDHFVKLTNSFLQVLWDKSLKNMAEQGRARNYKQIDLNTVLIYSLLIRYFYFPFEFHDEVYLSIEVRYILTYHLHLESKCFITNHIFNGI